MTGGATGRLAVLVLLALAACGPAPDAPRPSSGPPDLVYAPAGTRISLENTVNGDASRSRITLTEPAGLRAGFVDEDGQTGSAYPGCWGCGGAMVIDEAAYAALWPLEAGKQVTFLRTAPDGQTARVFIRVAGRETVETPAGSFDAWMLDGRIENVTGPRYSAQVRAWWAPDPGWVVRAEGGDSQGNTLSSRVAGIDRP